MHPSMARRSLAMRLAVFSLLTLLASPALGQSTGGRILGRVADPSGAVLANVSVRITNQATGVARDTKTNGSGDYTFVEVAPGNYTAEFEQKGFKRNVQKDVTVDVNQVVTLNSTLQIGATAETVEVTSEAPLVDITSTQLGAVVNDRSVSQLPLNARDTYEFFRNTKLNANPYCFTAVDGIPCDKPQFNQNQFGGTFGGPIVKDRTFFFTSYEGRRIRQGIPSSLVFVPSASERPSATQPFADFSSESTFSGSTDANALNLRPNCTTALGSAPNIPTDGRFYSDLFPGNIIPLGCLDPTAVDLLQFVPTPANNSDKLVTTPVQPVRAGQFTVRLDHRLNNKQNLSFYYYFNDDHLVSPFAVFEAAGANVPGFGSIVNERFQQWNISHTWSISNTTVNEFRFNYNREAQRTFQHPVFTTTVQNSCPPAPSWLLAAFPSGVPCFSDGTQANTLGIHPNLGPQHEGLPFIQVSGGFTIGNNGEGELPQVGNSFQRSEEHTSELQSPMYL